MEPVGVAEFVLGDEARDWVRKRLSEWPGGALGAAVLERVDLARSTPLTFAWKDVDADRLADFEGSVTEWLQVDDIRRNRPIAVAAFEALSRRLLPLLVPGTCLVVIDSVAAPSDLWLRSAGGRHLFCEERVYTLLVPDEFPDLYNEGPQPFGVLASIPESLLGMGPNEKRDVPLDCMREVASGTRALYAEAYDGESYVFCERAG